jgi:hypothetical protein
MNRVDLKVTSATEALLSGLVGQKIQAVKVPKPRGKGDRTQASGHSACALELGSRTLFLSCIDRSFEDRSEEFLLVADESIDLRIWPAGPAVEWENLPWPDIEGQRIDEISITVSNWSPDHSAEDGVLFRLGSGNQLRIVASALPATLDLILCQPDSPAAMMGRKISRTLGVLA